VIPERCDHRVVNAAGAFYCDQLMRFGVRVFLFQEGMLHAKTLTIDDELAMFGSANYDIRSFSLNFELNLFMHSAEAVEAMHGLQQEYLDKSLQSRAGQVAAANAGKPVEDEIWPSCSVRCCRRGARHVRSRERLVGTHTSVAPR